MSEELEAFEEMISAPCKWCSGTKSIAYNYPGNDLERYWCRECGGSGLCRTQRPCVRFIEGLYPEVAATKLAPYLWDIYDE